MSLKAYIGDLRYDYCGVLANDCMPLGVSYLKTVMDRDVPEVESRLFAYPSKLLDALRNDPPDVLMLSNYMWCEELSHYFARVAKRINPNMLVVFGGPNIHIEDERQKEYMQAHPEVDVFVLGEGDFLAAEVMKHYLDTGMSLKKLGERTLPSSLYRGPDGEIRLEKMWDRRREIDDIPSPWLTGALDEFFDGRLVPMIETNRGCPFSCTFCVQGTRWYTKVHYFSLDRIREEIQYISRKVQEHCPQVGTLRIADSNYGMFERDIEISGYIGEMQKQYKWPTMIDATTGKNRPERIIESLEKVSGALVLYQAVQSLDEDVLRKIKRQNIKLEAYEQLQVSVRGRGLRSNSDLILALPGETLETHIRAIHKLVDAGVDQVSTFQLILLKGSEMETLASREEFSFEQRYRISPKTFGEYDDEKVFDIEHVVVATDTLPFEDYVKARIYALGCAALWHDNNFDDVLKLTDRWGIKRSEWLERMMTELQAAEEPIRGFVENFVAETKGELFPTREACIAFYSQPDNFSRLLKSEIGDNVVRKYQAIASLFIWQQLCTLVTDATRSLLIERGASGAISQFNEFWGNFATYTRYKHADGHNETDILTPVRVTLEYDVQRWIEDGMPNDVASYRPSDPEEFEFTLSPDGAHGLSAAIKVYGSELKGLIRMMKRIRASWLTRECRNSSTLAFAAAQSHTMSQAASKFEQEQARLYR